MSKSIAIKVENLSKSYPFKQINSHTSNQKLAVNKLSFNVHKGETIALIGSNGSGKSTLLSILSGITKPSTGKAILYGSVASILQIGDNFHPDLSGRENTHLYFKLLGFSEKDIETMADKVNAFSELEGYYDMPVKVYSQGMFLRLAFSVAFHKDADIYLLDEVMGVGDDAFKLKAEMVLKQLREQGKTLVMATHDKQEVIAMSNRCLWLEKGRLIKFEKPQNTIVEYSKFQRLRFEKGLSAKVKQEQKILSNKDGISQYNFEQEQYGNDNLWVDHVHIYSKTKASLYKEETIIIEVGLYKKVKEAALTCQFKVRDAFNNPVFFTLSIYNKEHKALEQGTEAFTGNLLFRCEVPAYTLAGGEYYLSVFFGKKTTRNTNAVYNERAYKFPNEIAFTVRSKGDEYLSEPIHYAHNPAWKWSLQRE